MDCPLVDLPCHLFPETFFPNACKRAFVPIPDDVSVKWSAFWSGYPGWKQASGVSRLYFAFVLVGTRKGRY